MDQESVPEPPLGDFDHPRVAPFVEYYRGPARDYFRRWLARSTRYLPMIREIFREEGIPADLAYLALVESGFNPYARSRSGAVGMWQFMKGTARKYGLRVDWWVDERKDPVKATRAAARYLKDLFELFRSWELAIAAYNAGEGKVIRALQRRKARSFWELCRYRDLKKETRDFVPKFLAALTISRDPGAYGFVDVPYEEPWRFDRVPVKGVLGLDTVARLAGTDEETVRRLNPQILRWCTPPDKEGVELTLPEGTRDRFLAGLARLPKEERVRVVVYKIRQGDTLGKISRRFGSPLSLIKRFNRLRSIHRIRAGRRLMIPVPAKGKTQTPVRIASRRPSSPHDSLRLGSGREKEKEKEKTFIHYVKPGETLWEISKKYGVAVSDISRWNGLESSRIYPGDELILRSGEI